METQASTFERVNAMPASTWRFLKMNDTELSVPGGLAIAPDVQASGSSFVRRCSEGHHAPSAFARMLAEAQAEWEATHPAPTPEEIAQREEFLAAEADATYGGVALSEYQAGADRLEQKRDLAASFIHGTSEGVAECLRSASDGFIDIVAEEGEQIDARVIVRGAHGVMSVAAVDVVAKPRSVVELSLVVDGEGGIQADECSDGGVTGGSDALQDEPARDSADRSPQNIGFAGTTVRVFAGKGAQVRVARVQTLDDGLADIDDMALFADDDARISVRQTVLGASASYVGLAGDLRGDSSSVDVDTRYLGRGSQERDFNYQLRHHGCKTTCDLRANGVLAGESAKTLRGTIDFIRGCKGSQGSESETVLLVDERVRNKTVPVILCNEDDVAGNHGATIGHVRDEQLFYLASRGLSQEAAEAMFVNAVIEQAAIDAIDDTARAAAIRFGEKVIPDFAEYIDSRG